MSVSASAAPVKPSSRKMFIALWLIPLVLMVTAWIVYYLVQTGRIALGSINEGVLIQPPIALSELDIRTDDGKMLSEAMLNKWLVVILGDASCDESCRSSLYLTRQVHIRLNKDAHRLQRVYLSNGLPLDQSLEEYMATEHPHLLLAQADPATWQRLSKQSAQSTAQYLLIDPQGWLMMYYQHEHEAGQLMKDLKRLLKFSRES